MCWYQNYEPFWNIPFLCIRHKQTGVQCNVPSRISMKWWSYFSELCCVNIWPQSHVILVKINQTEVNLMPISPFWGWKNEIMTLLYGNKYQYSFKTVIYIPTLIHFSYRTRKMTVFFIANFYQTCLTVRLTLVKTVIK